MMWSCFSGITVNYLFQPEHYHSQYVILSVLNKPAAEAMHSVPTSVKCTVAMTSLLTLLAYLA